MPRHFVSLNLLSFSILKLKALDALVFIFSFVPNKHILVDIPETSIQKSEYVTSLGTFLPTLQKCISYDLTTFSW